MCCARIHVSKNWELMGIPGMIPKGQGCTKTKNLQKAVTKLIFIGST